jgi:uncharacterized protein (DUF433 family)
MADATEKPRLVQVAEHLQRHGVEFLVIGGQVAALIGEYIPVKPGFCGRKPHIIDHRIKVQHMALWRERLGMTPEEIVATYPSLSLPAVFAALAYYHGHRAEIDADIEADARFVAEMKAKAGPSRLQVEGTGSQVGGEPPRGKGGHHVRRGF